VAQAPVGKGRPTHVRNRLIIAVAVVAAAIGAAGTPSVLALSAELKDSQELVTLAGQTQDALVLAHSLADERDQITAYLATGRDRKSAPDPQITARVDRQITDLRAAGNLPAAVDGIAAVRTSALAGKSTPLQAHESYSKTITELHRLAERLAQQTPPRAGAGAYALAELDSAVQQAAAARGLLVAALDVPVSDSYDTSGAAESRDALSAAAQQARVRSDAALADFRETAPASMTGAYDSTVTGGENDAAEKYLTQLTDQPVLNSDDLDADPAKVEAALSARVELMRGVEASLFDQRTKELEALRDEDVTSLELRVALLGALMLVAVGVATGMARSLTRPLSAVRRGAARLAGAQDPGAEEPVKFTGRNDEFAQVVRSVNALHAHAAGLHERIGTLEADRKHLVGQRQEMADARAELRAELDAATIRLEKLRASIGSTFVNLSLRTLGLVERQLAVIEGLEEREQDPERLATLFKLDHFATVMRRHNENLLVLAGARHEQQHPGPVPLVDVVRAAVSEIEHYERVRISSLPPHAHIAGFAADDLSHLLAELMENATSFSPPDLPVEVSGWLLENGDVMLSVQDEGVGIESARRDALNSRLAEPDLESPVAGGDFAGEDAEGLGLHVVSRLAHRHAVRVRLRGQKKSSGTAAVVVVPTAVLSPAPSGAVPSATATGAPPSGTVSLPGADAEVNSHVIGVRSRGGDLAVELAERAIRRAGGGVPSAGAEAAVADGGGGVVAGDDAGFGVAGGDGEDGEAGQRGEAVAAVSHEASASVEALASDGESVSGEALASDGESASGEALASAAESAPGDPVDPADLAERAGAEADDSAVRTASDPAEPGTSDELPVSSETTMALLLPPAPRGETVPGAGPGAGPGGDPRADVTPASPEHARAESEEQVTAKGLPKRTPKVTAPEPVVRPKAGGVDAEALRKRLGGFRQGAVAGYRDAESELAEEPATAEQPAQHGELPAQREQRAERTSAGEAMGGTVEEASS